MKLYTEFMFAIYVIAFILTLTMLPSKKPAQIKTSIKYIIFLYIPFMIWTGYLVWRVY